jgi:hypothetical protein
MTVAMRSVVVYEREGRREKEGTMTKIGKQRARATRKRPPCFVLSWQQSGRAKAVFAVASLSSCGYRMDVGTER